MLQHNPIFTADHPTLITHSPVEQASSLCGLVGIPAAFSLLNDPAGEETLIGFYGPYLRLARKAASGLLLEAPSARATAAWGRRWGRYDYAALNRQAVRFVALLRSYADPAARFVRIAGAIGPCSPDPGNAPLPEAALLAHFEQAECLAAAGVDLLVATAIPTTDEAIGLTMAAAAVERPLLVTLATDGSGLLRNGQPLSEAIAEIDVACPEKLRPLGYGIASADLSTARGMLRGLGGQAMRVKALSLSAALFLPSADAESREEQVLQALPWCRPDADIRAEFPQIAILGGAFQKARSSLNQPQLPCLAA